MLKKMKLLGAIILFIWVFGAVISAIFDELQRKKVCIEEEGIIKGFLWCKTDPTTQSQQGYSHTANVIKGLGWPLSFINQKDTDDNFPSAGQSTSNKLVTAVIGIDRTAEYLLRHVKKKLPIKLDEITTWIDADYNRKKRIYDFIILINENEVEQVLSFFKMINGIKGDKEDELDSIFNKNREAFYESLILEEKQRQVKYYCIHENFGPLIKKGIKIKFTYQAGHYESGFYVEENDCI